jgi:SAM-dependent methyltransferase
MNSVEEAPGGLRLDLGCGSTKKEGTIGLDFQSLPGVDYVLDIESQPLPFADQSVEYVFSSHFLEHTYNPGNVLAEVGRVCIDGAQLEFWTPYAWHNDAFLPGHNIFFTEEYYRHICELFPDFWSELFHSRWVLNEVQYVIPEDVLHELSAQNISVAFAVKHLHNIVKEFGVHITVRHQPPPQVAPSRHTYSTNRNGQRHDLTAEPQASPVVSEPTPGLRRLLPRPLKRLIKSVFYSQ